MSNLLSPEIQAEVTRLLKDGLSLRQIRAATDVSMNTVLRYSQMLKEEIICEHGIRKYMCRMCLSGKSRQSKEKISAAIQWPENMACPKCGHGEFYEMRSRPERRCKACKHKTSRTALTFLKNHKLPIDVFAVASELSHLNINQMAKALGVTWKTAQSIRQKINAAL